MLQRHIFEYCRKPELQWPHWLGSDRANNEKKENEIPISGILEILRHCVLCFKCIILFHPRSNARTWCYWAHFTDKETGDIQMMRKKGRTLTQMYLTLKFRALQTKLWKAGGKGRGEEEKYLDNISKGREDRKYTSRLAWQFNVYLLIQSWIHILTASI